MDGPGLLLRQQLGLLGHLEEDLPSQDPNWPQLRNDRARLWLELLQQVRELAGPEPDPDEAPSLSVPVPDEVDLTLGVAPEAITNQARSSYAQSLERFRRYHEMQRLLQQYQPRALRYLTRAFAEQPHDMEAMQRLLIEFDLPAAESDKPETA